MPDIKIKGYSGKEKAYQNVEKVYLSAAHGDQKLPYTYGESVSKTVEPDFAGGDMEVEIPAGELVTALTLKKPDTLVPENIAQGVTVAGVTGEFAGGSGYTTRQIAGRSIYGPIADADTSTIGSYAFYGTGITSAAFPNCSLLGEGAFGNCLSLSSIDLSFGSISQVAPSTFQGTTISAMSLPSCTQIGSSAFQNCKSLTRIDAPTCSSVFDSAFDGCTNLSEITLSTSFSRVNSGTFRNCSNLQTIDNTLAKVYAEGFCNCVNLSEIRIQNFQNIIGEKAFYGCSNLSRILGSGMTFGNLSDGNGNPIGLGTSAFAYCVNLQEISMCFATECNANSVFYGCKKLSKVTLLSNTSVISIDAHWFYNTPIHNSSYLGRYGSIYVPSSLYSAFKRASGWSDYSARMVSYTPT